MPFNLFHKKKEPEPETPAVAPQTETQPEAPAEPIIEAAPEAAADPQQTPEAEPQMEPQVPVETEAAPQAPSETVQPAAQEPQPQAAAVEPEAEQPKPEVANKTYLKAMPLKDLSDVESVKEEVGNGNIIILRVTPLAGKSIEDVKTAVNDLFQFAEASGGDIARLGEERVVICPKTVRIWREKTPAPVASTKPLPTAA
ncbi:MAG: cell division protein SepF [Candidatus Bathyarchaeota archaeon]|nr:cell division protein SepF [Candidatus Bathyarchaeota archaeon]